MCRLRNVHYANYQNITMLSYALMPRTFSLTNSGNRGVRRSTVSQELSIHHLWCFLGSSKGRLSAWQMRSQGPLAPCRFSRVTTLRRVTATGSLPKFWLYKTVVACSLTTCQVTVVGRLSVFWLRVRQQNTQILRSYKPERHNYKSHWCTCEGLTCFASGLTHLQHCTHALQVIFTFSVTHQNLFVSLSSNNVLNVFPSS